MSPCSPIPPPYGHRFGLRRGRQPGHPGHRRRPHHRYHRRHHHARRDQRRCPHRRRARPALTISGTTTGIEDGQVATVNFNGNNYTGIVTAGVFSVTVPAVDVALLADTTTYTATASVSDAAGNPATPDTEDVHTTDTTAGTITLDEISADVLTAAERGLPLTISGTTTGIEDGQVATVNFNGNNYTGIVTAGVFSVTVPRRRCRPARRYHHLHGHRFGLRRGRQPGHPGHRRRPHHRYHRRHHHARRDQRRCPHRRRARPALTISGTTTGIEDGQVATVNFNGNNYTGIVTAGVFSVTVPAVDVALLADTTTYMATASVSDAAGNPPPRTPKTSTPPIPPPAPSRSTRSAPMSSPPPSAACP
ncbi:MAG: hypothetical protein IPH73_08725 [Rhodocyclales bacterium]|nr:hypothetical protein [Rhodocyclales bacterium]